MHYETQSTELTQPTHLTSLATSAVLVSVDVNVWSATKQDRGISNEVTKGNKKVRHLQGLPTA